MLWPAMTKPEIAKRIAREKQLLALDAADQLDWTVNQIVLTLRKGQAAHLPGLGTITPGKRWTLREEKP